MHSPSAASEIMTAVEQINRGSQQQAAAAQQTSAALAQIERSAQVAQDKGKLASEGYILDFETIYQKVAETVELGGTGVLLQGGR